MLKRKGFNVINAGPNENDSGLRTRPCEVYVLAEKSVARMDGLRAALLCDFEDRIDRQITLRGWRRTDAIGFVRIQGMTGICVCLGIDSHRSDSHLLESSEDPASDRATIGDQNLI